VKEPRTRQLHPCFEWRYEQCLVRTAALDAPNVLSLMKGPCCRALNGPARRRQLWVRAVRKITNQRSAALLESLTSETKLIPAVQPDASDAAPPASEPRDDVTKGDDGDRSPLAKVSVVSGKPDDDAQTGNMSCPHPQTHLSSIVISTYRVFAYRVIFCSLHPRSAYRVNFCSLHPRS
jgi:hypothetical protein